MPLLHHRGENQESAHQDTGRQQRGGSTWNDNGAQRRDSTAGLPLTSCGAGPTPEDWVLSSWLLVLYPGKESRLPLRLRTPACVCYTTGTWDQTQDPGRGDPLPDVRGTAVWVLVLVRDPGLAPGLCLLPKQVGRCLPMSLEFGAAERSRTSNTPRLRRRRLPGCATTAICFGAQ